MLNDLDKWSNTCRQCGYAIEGEIGRLKQVDELICPRCSTVFEFDKASFDKTIEHYRFHIRTMMGNHNFILRQITR
jgi:hypothetical protein